MFGENHDFVAVNVSVDGLPEKKKKTNLWRWWNQLSRFQRSVFYMIVSILCFTTLYFSIGSIDNATVKSNKQEIASPLSKENLENYVKDQANELQEVEQQIPAVFQKYDKSSVLFKGPTNKRQEAVVQAFKHAWKGYKEFAWGHDHLKPISESYHDWFGLGLTIVDSLDTIYIMGLKEEFAEARNWVSEHLNLNQDRDVNLFETTIRVLGGLLSAYHLSGDSMFLDKAIDLGLRLLPSFKTESGIPFSDVNLATKLSHPPKWSPVSSTSEVATLQLEFTDLSRSSGNFIFEKTAAYVSEHIHKLTKKDGLVPIFINAFSGNFRSYSTITFGARGDSYYEYLVKQWIQTGKTIDYLKEDYLEAIEGMKKNLVQRTVPNGYLFVGELLGGGKEFKPKMDHLTCYLPGTLALGVHHGLPSDHMKLAYDLLETCYQTYAQQPTFLAPEITYFNIQFFTDGVQTISVVINQTLLKKALGRLVGYSIEAVYDALMRSISSFGRILTTKNFWYYFEYPSDQTNDIYVKTPDAHNLLRPEFIESLWYMYQITKNTTYQDWGWQIFEAFEKYTKVSNGYTSIGDVRNPENVKPRDMMESFFLSETIKYLYLLFSDDPKLIDIDRYVMNSEAHPLPIRA